MEIIKITLDRGEFNRIPEKERTFLLLISKFANEISMLHKLTLYSNYQREGETIQEAQNFQSFFLLQLLAGKLSEGYKILKAAYYNSESLAKFYDQLLSEKARSALDELKRYFGNGDNLIDTIRNKTAFHFDKEFIRSGLEKFPEQEELKLFIVDNHGNSLYSMSHNISSWALLSHVDESNPKGALERILQEVFENSDRFLTFFNEIMDAWWKGKQISIKTETIELKEVLKMGSIRIPFFVARD